MKSRIKKFFNKLNNKGSSLILVIASVGFIGILVGALLIAVGYAYKLKLYDLNARDNFYYVEQAMEEVYAGVGTKTLDNMKEAYNDTLENMTYYDLNQSSYVTISDDAANTYFKEKFMTLMKEDDFFKGTQVADELEKFITNSTVELDKSNIKVNVEMDGTNIQKISVKNVVLVRTVEYARSKANGTFTQKISADIDVARPDFTVDFNSLKMDYSNIFEFAMISDMGVEVNQDPSNAITISGNIYASNDYYNKQYNYLTGDKNYSETYNAGLTDESTISYDHNVVSSKKYVADGTNELFNNNYFKESGGLTLYYDGVNQNSMYSGLMVNGSNVSILGNRVIVPGSISVLNSGDLSIYSKDGKAVTEAEVWTDNLILDGYAIRTSAADSTKKTYEGSTAVIRANLFVKDDFEINSNYSKFNLVGGYFGYSDSTDKDNRVFIPTVDKNNFQIETVDADGNVVSQNRGHYNSSAILVNGENSTIDLSKTTNIFLAGRSYIELSKEINKEDVAIGEGDDSQKVVSQTYTFLNETGDLYSTDPDAKTSLRDYKTGESISVKPNQLAYIPVMLTGTPELGDYNGVTSYYAKLHPSVVSSDLFVKHFGSELCNNGVPTIIQAINGRKHYYYDFKNIWELNKSNVDYVANFATADDVAKSFIKAYTEEINNETSSISEYLIDIGNYEDFEYGSIILPDYDIKTNYNIYSSGSITSYANAAISAQANTPFTMVLKDDMNTVNLLTTENYGTDAQAIKMSDDLMKTYNYMKWNLDKFDTTTFEDKYIDALVASSDFGEGSITPINRYMNFDKIVSSTSIRPKLLDTDNGSGILDLKSGYSVWIDYNDVTIKAKDGNEGIVRGIVITKGDVYFDENVTKFEGIIICGGKMYINNNLSTFNASPEIIKAILRECEAMGTEQSKLLTGLFKFYDSANTGTDDTDDSSVKTVDTLNYSDVIGYNNWMKNVE